MESEENKDNLYIEKDSGHEKISTGNRSFTAGYVSSEHAERVIRASPTRKISTNDELFILTHGRCSQNGHHSAEVQWSGQNASSGRRSGEGHVTPEFLQNKLEEFKYQLNFVKSLYSSSPTNNSTTNTINNINTTTTSTSHNNNNNNNDNSNDNKNNIDSNNVSTRINGEQSEENKYHQSKILEKLDKSKLSLELSSFSSSQSESSDGNIPDTQRNKRETKKISNGRRIDQTQTSKPNVIQKKIQSKSVKTETKVGASSKIPRKNFIQTKNLSNGNPTTTVPTRNNNNGQLKQSRQPSHILKNKNTTSSGINKKPTTDKRQSNRPVTDGTKTRFHGNHQKQMDRSDSDISSCSNYSTKSDAPKTQKKNVRIKSTDKSGIIPSLQRATTRETNCDNQLKEKYERKLKDIQKETSQNISLQELSFSLKEKHLEGIRDELQAKCENYEKHIHHLEQVSRDQNSRTGDLEMNYHKLKWDHARLSGEYEEMHRKKSALENEVLQYQQKLSESICTQKEVQKHAEDIRIREVHLGKELEIISKENMKLKEELKEMKSAYLESENEMRYYRNAEQDLQEYMNKTINQITQLEEQSMEQCKQHNISYEKLLNEHKDLSREHEAIKMLYRESLRRIEDLTNDCNPAMKCSLQTRSLSSSREILNEEDIYFNRSFNRNHSSFFTPNISPHGSRTPSLRRTWFSQDIPLSQSLLTNSGGGFAGGHSFNDINSRLLNSAPRRTHTSRHNRHRRYNYDYFTDPNISDSDSTVSSRSAASVKSCTIEIEQELSKRWRVANQLQRPHSSVDDNVSRSFDMEISSSVNRNDIANNKPVETVQRRPQSWYVPFQKKHKGPKNTNKEKRCAAKELSDIFEDKKYNPTNKRTFVPTKTSNGQSLALSSAASRLQNHTTSSRHINQSVVTNRAITSTQDTTNIPAKTTKSEIPKSNSFISTPCNVARTYLTTEEVLAAVQETQSDAKQNTGQTSLSKTPSRFEQLSISRGIDEAREIILLEQKLTELTTEKEKLDSKLGRIPSQRTSNSRKLEEELGNRHDEVTKELASVRMAMRRLRIL